MMNRPNALLIGASITNINLKSFKKKLNPKQFNQI